MIKGTSLNNSQWNEAARWAVAHTYTGDSLAPSLKILKQRKPPYKFEEYAEVEVNGRRALDNAGYRLVKNPFSKKMSIAPKPSPPFRRDVAAIDYEALRAAQRKVGEQTSKGLGSQAALKNALKSGKKISKKAIVIGIGIFLAVVLIIKKLF